MVPRGGIEPSPIQLKVHRFSNDDVPVYLLVDPALSSRPEGATLCRHIGDLAPFHPQLKSIVLLNFRIGPFLVSQDVTKIALAKGLLVLTYFRR